MLIDYHNPSTLPRRTRPRGVRILAAALALAAFALAVGATAKGWVQNSVLEAGVVMLVVVGAMLTLRALRRDGAALWAGWIGAIVVFGLWAALVVSNQTHGRPPPSDRYFIAAFAAACVLSGVALAVDTRYTRAQA